VGAVHTYKYDMSDQKASFPLRINSSAVEAIEFSRSSIMTNGTLLLYILAFSKVEEKPYRLIKANPHREAGYAATPHISPSETYAILSGCLSVGNKTVCQEKELLQLEVDGCIFRLLKRGYAVSSYLRNNRQLIEAVNEVKLFKTNFNGTLKAAPGNHRLVGTFDVQYDNELLDQLPDGIAGRPNTSNSQRLPAISGVRT